MFRTGAYPEIPLIPMTALKQSKTTKAATCTMWRRTVVSSAVNPVAKAVDFIVAASHREGRAKNREVV